MNFFSLDSRLFNWINHLPHPKWADQTALLLAGAGSRKFLLALAGLLFLMGLLLRKREVWFRSLFLTAAILLTGFIVFFLKEAVERTRPCDLLENVHRIGNGWGWSFPSGHAALYATTAFFFTFVFKRLWWFWMGLVFLGGMGRVYQGLHYPSDVAAGWAIGYLVSFGVGLWYKSLSKFLERKKERLVV
ncbi:MAG: phosphatase PAP2 family protein [Candidatus Omnitrophica bacterium]|nr:phosphatase PAP2 family protein [Candidatus Omnitrophota bacterium]